MVAPTSAVVSTPGDGEAASNVESRQKTLEWRRGRIGPSGRYGGARRRWTAARRNRAGRPGRRLCGVPGGSERANESGSAEPPGIPPEQIVFLPPRQRLLCPLTTSVSCKKGPAQGSARGQFVSTPLEGRPRIANAVCAPTTVTLPTRAPDAREHPATASGTQRPGSHDGRRLQRKSPGAAGASSGLPLVVRGKWEPRPQLTYQGRYNPATRKAA